MNLGSNKFLANKELVEKLISSENILAKITRRMMLTYDLRFAFRFRPLKSITERKYPFEFSMGYVLDSSGTALKLFAFLVHFYLCVKFGYILCMSD